MKLRRSKKSNAAMTLFEVGIVIAVVLILMAIFLPVLSRPGLSPRSGINCVNNLKQVGLAYKIWAGDNDDKFPMGVSVTNGGTMELAASGNVFSNFLVMSNELSTPRILICPMDKIHVPSRDFGYFGPSNVSYFIGIDATNDSNPQQFLSGDSHFAIGGTPVKPGLLNLWTNDPVAWTATRHPGNSGNIGLADGSVSQTTSLRLRNFLQDTGFATNRLAIP